MLRRRRRTENPPKSTFVSKCLPRRASVKDTLAWSDFARYQSETKFSDGVLHYKRTFETKDVMVSKDELPAARNFLEQVAADQQSAAVLRRATR